MSEMNNVYGVRVEEQEETGMAVFVVSASSIDQAIDTVLESKEYEWLENYYDLKVIKYVDVTEYGITSQPASVLDSYEYFSQW